jgi:hypothetical protein
MRAALKDVAAGGEEERTFEPVGLTLSGERVEDKVEPKKPHLQGREPIA